MACEFQLSQILEATDGKALSTHEKSFFGVGTDTRQAMNGQIFIALKGDEHDAHKYIDKAERAGAKCIIVHEESSLTTEVSQKVTVVKVKDTLKALQDLAKFWRGKFKAKVIGITGSNGKTTTKEFTATILSRQFKVCASKGSFNNHWGVPITLLQVSKFDDFAIIEMGMNHSGEIAALSHIAKPDVVLCTMVGRSHIGNFKNGIDGIAAAKEEIYIENPKALQIFNFDNEHTIAMFERASKLIGADHCRAFSSFAGGAEVGLRATFMTLDYLQVMGHIGGIKGEAKVSVYGRQNIVNLMAAASIAFAVGMEPEQVWASLPNCKSGWGRNQLVQLDNGPRVLFDGYNANPDSMAILMKNFFETNSEGKKVCVLAEMLELGSDAGKFHYELGELIGNTDTEVIWFYGPSFADFERGVKASGSSKTLFISKSYDEELAKKVRNVLNPKDVVVVKGSRGMKLEKVIQLWSPNFSTAKN
jgi:UDP-N-acetylmuramoyl-tripeptide--D-alanyl-D-alanine ligase